MTLRITSNLRVFPVSSRSSNYVWKHPWSQAKAFIAFLKIPLSLQKQWGKSGSRGGKPKGMEMEGAGPRVEQLREGGPGRALPSLSHPPNPRHALRGPTHLSCLWPGHELLASPGLPLPRVSTIFRAPSVPFPNVEPQNQDFSSPCHVPPAGQTVGKQAATDPILPTNSRLTLFTPNISKKVHERRGDAGWILTMSPGHLTVLLSL